MQFPSHLVPGMVVGRWLSGFPHLYPVSEELYSCLVVVVFKWLR